MTSMLVHTEPIGADSSPTRPAGPATLTDVLGKFASPEVARFVLSSPREFWNKAERRTVTTLFADVRGFTAFAARVPPEAALATMNAIFELLCDVVGREHGIVNRFLGDGMLALFGAPLALDDHASAAATAALKARASIDGWAEARRRRGLEPLRIGLGINTGSLIAGCVGTPARTEYTVMGHSVNLASRLVAAAEPSQILIGPETAALLPSTFDVRHKGVMDFKGVGPTRVFELLS
jgi:adenylate cyclase